jgi:hypothetical protein
MVDVEGVLKGRENSGKILYELGGMTGERHGPASVGGGEGNLVNETIGYSYRDVSRVQITD